MPWKGIFLLFDKGRYEILKTVILVTVIVERERSVGERNELPRLSQYVRESKHFPFFSHAYKFSRRLIFGLVFARRLINMDTNDVVFSNFQ
jgi:hypothetical protein